MKSPRNELVTSVHPDGAVGPELVVLMNATSTSPATVPVGLVIVSDVPLAFANADARWAIATTSPDDY
jgi:hypothetical protein